MNTWYWMVMIYSAWHQWMTWIDSHKQTPGTSQRIWSWWYFVAIFRKRILKAFQKIWDFYDFLLVWHSINHPRASKTQKHVRVAAAFGHVSLSFDLRSTGIIAMAMAIHHVPNQLDNHPSHSLKIAVNWLTINCWDSWFIPLGIPWPIPHVCC